MESHPQNPEYKNNPGNFHSCSNTYLNLPVVFYTCKGMNLCQNETKGNISDLYIVIGRCIHYITHDQKQIKK